VLLEPGDAFYEAEQMRRLGVAWRSELAPHYATAARMLGRMTSPLTGVMDQHLRATAASVGAEDTFGPVPVAIHFGRPGVTEPDPFFGGDGPERTGCRLCGECLLGCPYGAKNQLTRNYLHLAEGRGAVIRPETEVVGLRPLPEGGYEVHTRHPWRRGEEQRFTAARVVLAGGVLGTVELLQRARDEAGTLPHVSPTVGQHVRTNSEAITAVLAPPGEDLSVGPTISSSFHPDPGTHTTLNRYIGGWHMRAQLGPLVDDERPPRRAARVAGALARHPLAQARLVGAKDLLRRLTVLTTMQDLDSELALELTRGRLGRSALRSRMATGQRPPSYLEVANRVTRAYAQVSGGRPLNLLGESVAGLSVTAHVLGGAVMGTGPHDGVVDADHEVFGHPGLYVADASVIPANLGVNPSLTITAMAERFASRFPPPAPDPVPLRSTRPSSPGATVTDTVLSLRRAWSSLEVVDLDALEGDWEAEFVAPLRRVAPAGLGLIGLPRWFGKRFTSGARGVVGVNLLRRGAGEELAETLPMEVAAEPSYSDSAPCVAVSYPSGSRRPWPWVRDELRRRDEDTLVGMTYVNLPGLRAAGGTPFLLRRRRG
ncbi:MAG: FAD-dependent oxidoreductase, partial [Nocardioides sp.]|uniref:FAD-dependent oxidoreductase n=1 Tax=Nocardioides sp. TaxID=35761 RepID=UPI003F11BE8C